MFTEKEIIALIAVRMYQSAASVVADAAFRGGKAEPPSAMQIAEEAVDLYDAVVEAIDRRNKKMDLPF